MPFNLGMTELLVILMVVLLFFGAKRLPEMGGAMGKGIREFRKNIREIKDSIDEPLDDDAKPRRLDAPHDDTEGEPKKLSE
jgi:sec-independent protein translocase protein TatA